MSKGLYILTLGAILLGGCKAAHETKSKGIFVRIVNDSPIEVKSYKMGGIHFAGLKPKDTGAYQFLKKFNSGEEICGTIANNIMLCSEIYDCRKCDVDSPKFLTLRACKEIRVTFL